MKYARNDSGEVIEVKGCTTCPHMASIKGDDDWNYMHCQVPTLRADGTRKPINKKLVGKWTGAYHASCPLVSMPENVPAFKEVGK
jgi:hypothetical protein